MAAEEWIQILRSSPAVPGDRLRMSGHRSSTALTSEDGFRVFDGRLAQMLAEDDPVFENWDQNETAIRTLSSRIRKWWRTNWRRLRRRLWLARFRSAGSARSDRTALERIRVHRRESQPVPAARCRPSPLGRHRSAGRGVLLVRGAPSRRLTRRRRLTRSTTADPIALHWRHGRVVRFGLRARRLPRGRCGFRRAGAGTARRHGTPAMSYRWMRSVGWPISGCSVGRTGGVRRSGRLHQPVYRHRGGRPGRPVTRHHPGGRGRARHQPAGAFRHRRNKNSAGFRTCWLAGRWPPSP